MIQSKACTKCGQIKPLDQYYFSSNKYEARCKECRRAETLDRQNQRAASRQTIDQSGVKHCNSCQTTKPKLEFNLRKGSIDGLSSECKICASNRTKAYYHSEVGLASHLAIRAQSTKIEERTGQESELDRVFILELLERQNGMCSLSGIKMLADQDSCVESRGYLKPSVDRIDSSKGYVKDNVRLILSCLNQAKGPWTDTELLKMAEAWLIERGYSVSKPQVEVLS